MVSSGEPYLVVWYLVVADSPGPPCELFCGLTAYKRRQTNHEDLGEPIYTTK